MKKAKTAKGGAEKRAAAKLLANVPDEYVFFCTDGRIFRNLEELCDGLDGMSDDAFSYHSNCEKRDFSNWLKDIVGDEELAQALVNAVTRTDAVATVSARVSSLRAKLL